jgi:hypothetical protein
MATVYELRDRLLALRPDERANLLALIEHEDARARFEPTREDSEVWTALTKLTVAPHRSLDLFLRDKQHGVSRKTWTEAVQAIYVFVAQAKPVRRAAQDHAALVELAVHVLVRDLTGRGVEVSPRTVVEAVPRLRAAFERCYPGYAEAGLLHLLIRRASARELEAAAP